MPRKIVTGTPKWNEERQCWELQVRKGRSRRWFRSSEPGKRKGPAEVLQKAQAWLDSINPVEGGQRKFEEVWEEYMAYYSTKCKMSTADNARVRGNHWLVSRFRHKKLEKITKVDWQNVLTDMKMQGKSSHYITLIASNIRTFCKWCATKGYMADAEVPLYFDIPKLQKVEKKILQPEQLAILFSPEEDQSNWYIDAFRFLAVTGLRRGEICALRYDRDFDGESILVQETVTSEGVVQDSPKTENSKRRLFLGPLALKQIQTHRKKLENIGKGDAEYVFCSAYGYRMYPKVLYAQWRAWGKAHNMDFTIHELRHSYISYSRLKTNIGIEDLKRLYGHAPSMDTDAVYVHEIDKTPDEKIAEIKKEKETVGVIDSTLSLIINEQASSEGLEESN